MTATHPQQYTECKKIMEAALLSEGNASTTGLTVTSINPDPTAAITVASIIPAYASDMIYGKIPTPINPAAQHKLANIQLARYPILSTNLTQNTSTSSCTQKFMVINNASCSSVMAKSWVNVTKSNGQRLFKVDCVI